MACEISAPYNKGCDVSGGIATLYAFAVKDSTGASNIATLTMTGGTITALTLDALKYAYPLNVEIETASITDAATGVKANGAYAREQSATVVLHGNTPSMITELEALGKGRHALIAKLNDDTYEVFFLENGAKVSDVRATGTAFEDMNGNTLTWTGKERMKAQKISSAIVLTLLAP